MVDSAPVLAPVHHLDISPRPPPTPDNDTPPIGRLLLVSKPASWECAAHGRTSSNAMFEDPSLHYTLFPPKANKIPVIIHRLLSTLHLTRGQLPAEWDDSRAAKWALACHQSPSPTPPSLFPITIPLRIERPRRRALPDPLVGGDSTSASADGRPSPIQHHSAMSTLAPRPPHRYPAHASRHTSHPSPCHQRLLESFLLVIPCRV